MALLPPLLGMLLGSSSWGRTWGAWIGPGLAIAGGVAFTLARPRVRALVLLGTMLAVMAGLAAPQLPVELSDEQAFDLRTDSVPPELEGRVAVTGFFRAERTMAEYAVPEGALPQQDGPAEAVLVPLLGVESEAVPLRDVLVVARVRPGAERKGGLQTVRGLAQALDDELLAVFVQSSGLEIPSGMRGILVDAVDEHPTPVWLRSVLVVLATIASLACLWIAAQGREQPSAGAPRRRAHRAT